MDYPNTPDVELPSPAYASHFPPNHPSQLVAPSPPSTPHYIIATHEITADPDASMGSTRRTGSVFKGFWNNSLVAVKVLSSETPVDVRRISHFIQTRTLSKMTSKLQTLFDHINRWQVLRHPHVLQVFGVSDLDADPPFIISQYYPNGNATEFLIKNPTTDRAKIVSTAYGRLTV
jgi:hypothetical protein